MAFQSITLTEEEMKALDDGQEWYKPGDVVRLGGYSDTDGLDLFTNGHTHDNWTSRSDLRQSHPDILSRLHSRG